MSRMTVLEMSDFAGQFEPLSQASWKRCSAANHKIREILAIRWKVSGLTMLARPVKRRMNMAKMAKVDALAVGDWCASIGAQTYAPYMPSDSAIRPYTRRMD